jgi:hypothetical protein
MKRSALAFSVLAAVGGCVSFGNNPAGPMGGPGACGPGGCCPSGAAYSAQTVPGAVGPNGAPVPVRGGAYASNIPSGEAAARATIQNSMPRDVIQLASYQPDGGIMRTAAMQPPGMGGPGMPGAPGMGMPGPGMGMPGVCPPGGCPPGAGMPGPGMGMPGPGGGIGMGYPAGAVAAAGALTNPYCGQFASARMQIKFDGPPGMKIGWYVTGADGKREFNKDPLEVPARYNFQPGAVYRLKLSDIPDPDFAGKSLNPTLEVVPPGPKAMPFLAHTTVPMTFTQDDFRLVKAGNYLVKVVYLPDPTNQEIAIGATNELLSTQLAPGEDPVAVAAKLGTVLLVVRMGNIDLDLSHTPAMDAPPPCLVPPPGFLPPMMPPGGMGMPPPNGMQGRAPNGQPLPPGVIMGPNGPTLMPGLVMTPKGPVLAPGWIIGPNGPMPANQQGAAPNRQTPPNGATSVPGPGASAPVNQSLPALPTIGGARPTAAEMAAQPSR